MVCKTGINTFGKNAVVCGRSKNIGMPVAALLHSDGNHGNHSTSSEDGNA